MRNRAQRHSEGVARQYCGALGKIANGQVAVTLHRRNDEMNWPMGWELYLSEYWISDTELRKAAGIPGEIEFQTKPALAYKILALVVPRRHQP